MTQLMTSRKALPFPERVTVNGDKCAIAESKNTRCRTLEWLVDDSSAAMLGDRFDPDIGRLGDT
jgi:hypothetical protein